MRHVLVIEDEPSIADTILYALKTEGFRVTWCATGEEGSRAFDTDGADLIVLDVGLPDQNGFELCKRIRRTSAVPIIFLTARTAEIDRVIGLEIGGDDYIPKPFSPRELTARVKAVLRRAAAPEEKPADTAFNLPFVVDPERMRISYFDVLLDLSRYEFRILATLLRRPGRVYSREKLMELVWEAPESSMDRTVDTHIKTIRAKLRQIKPDIDPIQTHRGVGYSMRDSW